MPDRTESSKQPAPPAVKPIATALAQHAAAAHLAGDAQTHGIANEFLVAASELKQKAAAAKGKVPGELGEVIARLHELL